MSREYATGDGRKYICNLLDQRYVVELLSSRHSQKSEREMEYFVRVLGKDRRIDRWLHESDILEETNVQDSDALYAVTAAPSAPASAPKGTKRTITQMRKALDTSDPLHVFAIYDGIQADEEAAEHSKHLRDVKWVEKMVFGDHIIDAWYPSPFTRESIREEVTANGGKLYVDDISLKYTGNAARMLEHRQRHGEGQFGLRGPPGICLYDHGGWALWEMDGGEGAEYNNDLVESSQRDEISHLRTVEAAHRELYCQNMGLISKLFLDHKQECFTTSNFVYYVLTERYEREDEATTGRPFDSKTLRPAVGGTDYLFRGYFSREKGQMDYNLSCIMVLPPWQRSGIGRMLIHFSYLLSGREPRAKRGIGAGTPERPLSDLGKIVYLQYWKTRVVEFVRAWKTAGVVGTFNDIIVHTHLEKKDVMKALHSLGLLLEGTGSSVEIDWENAEENIEANFTPSRVAPTISEGHVYHVGMQFGFGDVDDESHDV